MLGGSRGGGLYTTPRMRKSTTPSFKSSAQGLINSFSLTGQLKKDDDMKKHHSFQHKMSQFSKIFFQQKNGLLISVGLFTVIVVSLSLYLIFSVFSNVSYQRTSQPVRTAVKKSAAELINDRVDPDFSGRIGDMDQAFEQAIAALRAADYRTYDNLVIQATREHCVNELPFKMDEQAEFNLMTQFAHMLDELASKGRALTLSAAHTVVSDDGSVWSKHNQDALAKHKGKRSAQCTAVSQLVEFSQRLYELTDEQKREIAGGKYTDTFDDSYEDWQRMHATEWVTGSLKQDSAHFMKALSWHNWNSADGDVDGREWEVEYRLESTIEHYCPAMQKNMDRSAFLNVIHQIHRELRTLDSEKKRAGKFKATFLQKSGEIVFVGLDFDRLEKGMLSCGFIDELFQYGQGSWDDRILATVEELQQGEVVAFEIHLEHLLRDGCPSVIANLEDGFESLSNLISHTTELVEYMTAGKGGVGDDEFIVTSDGALLHRTHARDLGYSYGQVYECQLINDLIRKFGDRNSDLKNEEEFAQKSDERLQEEIDELFEHRFSMQPAHDVATLVDHYAFGERHQFDTMCRAVLEAYESRLMQQFRDEGKESAMQNLLRSLQNAIATLNDPLSDKNKDKVTQSHEFLVIDSRDGWVYVENAKSKTYDRDVYVRSVLFDEVNRLIQQAHGISDLKSAKKSENEKYSKYENSAKSAKSTGLSKNGQSAKPAANKMDQLWDAVVSHDLITARHLFDRMFVGRCREQTSNLETTLADGFQLITEVVNYDESLTRKPQAFINFDSGKVTVAFPENRKAEFRADSRFKTCSVFDDVIAKLHLKQATQSDKQTSEQMNKQNSEQETRMQEKMNEKHAKAHVGDVRSHGDDASYVAKLLLEAAKELDLLAFDEEVKTLLDARCHYEVSQLSAKNYRRLRLQMFDAFDRVLMSDGKVGVKQPMFDTATGNLIDESELSSGKYNPRSVTQCSAFTAVFKAALKK